MKDYYKVLDVPCDASPQAIHEAYRKAVKKYHPDVRETGNHERFLEIREAYDVLSDPEKRRLYDRKRQQQNFILYESEGDDTWRYGGRKRYSRVFKSYCDLVVRAELILSRAEAYYGGFFTINVPFNVLCTSCNGMWWLSWTCRQCQGKGSMCMFLPITIKVPPRTIPGTIIIRECTDPWGRQVQVEFCCSVHNG